MARGNINYLKNYNNVKELKADIKRANTRIVAIAKKYGRESSAYKNAIASYSTSAFKPYINTTPSGVLQISSKIANEYKGGLREGSKLPREYLLKAQLSKTPTITDIKENTASLYGLTLSNFEKLSEEEQRAQVEKYYTKRDNFTIKKEMFYELEYTDTDRQKLLPDLYNNDGLTYEDITKIISRIDDLLESGEQPDPTTSTGSIIEKKKSDYLQHEITTPFGKKKKR